MSLMLLNGNVRKIKHGWDVLMNFLLMIVPLGITYYTFTYGLWAWRQGNRGGGIGVFLLAAFTLALSVYGLFFRTSY
jgi:hypothetical protein